MNVKDDIAKNIHYLGDHQELIPVLAEWIYREWAYLYPGATLRDFEGFLRERVNKNKLPLTLVAIEAGEPIGTVSLKAFDMETRNDLTPWLTSLYVTAPWRKKGLGSDLVTAIERKAVTLGIGRLFLFTADVALAERFYPRLGWRVKETTTYHSSPVIVMEKVLK